MINLGSYIFSIPPDVFEKIKPLIKELDDIYEKRPKLEKNDNMKLWDRESELDDRIEKLLLDADVKKEELELDPDGDCRPDEMGMVLTFKTTLFFEIDESVRTVYKIFENPLSPELTKKFTVWLLDLIEKTDAKKHLVDYAADKYDRYPKEQIEKVFDKWISMLKYSSEHGNWIYYHLK